MACGIVIFRWGEIFFSVSVVGATTRSVSTCHLVSQTILFCRSRNDRVFGLQGKGSDAES
jgi:hypothetical protein